MRANTARVQALETDGAIKPVKPAAANDLPESLVALRSMLRQFCEEKVRPHAARWDRDETFPLEIVRELGQLGVMGMLIPEEYGGSGMDETALAVAIEEIARYDGSLALTVASHNGLGSSHIRVF